MKVREHLRSKLRCLRGKLNHAGDRASASLLSAPARDPDKRSGRCIDRGHGHIRQPGLDKQHCPGDHCRHAEAGGRLTEVAENHRAADRGHADTGGHAKNQQEQPRHASWREDRRWRWWSLGRCSSIGTKLGRHSGNPIGLTGLANRAAFIRDVQNDLGVPMIHFTPPGMFGAPPYDQIGVGYDPDYARAQMAEAGYPDCTGFPPMEIAAFSGGVTGPTS